MLCRHLAQVPPLSSRFQHLQPLGGFVHAAFLQLLVALTLEGLLEILSGLTLRLPEDSLIGREVPGLKAQPAGFQCFSQLGPRRGELFG